METELIDETVLEAPPERASLSELHWNRLQGKVYAYLTFDRPGDSQRLLALGSLIKLGMFTPGISFEETKDILDEYEETMEVQESFCMDGRDRFVARMKHREPPPSRKNFVDSCGCAECQAVRARRNDF